jgi:hypothetical protein
MANLIRTPGFHPGVASGLGISRVTMAKYVSLMNPMQLEKVSALVHASQRQHA